MILRRSFRLRLAPVAAASLVVTVAACGGHSSAPGGTPPEPSDKQTVTSFMQAVADSNLSKIAQLWGTSKGPAAATHQPSDYERRIVLIQSYLRHDDYRIVADAAAGGNQRAVQVEIRRQACTWTIPFTLVKTDGGSWLVSEIDLTKAGNPVRPCDPNAQKAQGDSTTKP